jgi:glyoxylate/hydroxypyruvate reductase
MKPKRKKTTAAKGQRERGAASAVRLIRPGRKVHLHIENNRALGEVFEISAARVKAALARRSALKGKLKITIGYDGDIFATAMRTAEALFGWRFPREHLAERAPHLRWVHNHGAGVNHLMPLDWLPRGAVLTNSRGVHGPKADEYNIMALLMLNAQLPRLLESQRRARWEPRYGTAIAGKTLLILGVGHIGGGAARWAKRFGLHVIGIRRSGRPHRHVDEMHRPEALRRLLPRADFVLIAAPNTAASRRMLGARELELMKPGAGIVNYSRGELLDYAALQRHLAAGRLAAVVDVTDPEPLPRSSPLWRTPNLIITPHCSSDDRELYTPKTLDLVFKNMERFIQGKPLLNRVSAKHQY